MIRKAKPSGAPRESLRERIAEYELWIARWESIGLWEDAKDLRAHINRITGSEIEHTWSHRLRYQGRRKKP